MITPDSGRTPSEDDLLELVAVVLAEDEPPPPGAVEFATSALIWRDIDGDLAELLHDSGVEDTVVLRDDATTDRLLVFQARGITLDIEQGHDRLGGSISPPGRYRVSLLRAAAGTGHLEEEPVLTDDAGMFEVHGTFRGSIRFRVSDAGGLMTIVSPWITL